MTSYIMLLDDIERYPESLLKILHEQAEKKLFPGVGGWGWLGVGWVFVQFRDWFKPINKGKIWVRYWQDISEMWLRYVESFSFILLYLAKI